MRYERELESVLEFKFAWKGAMLFFNLWICISILDLRHFSYYYTRMYFRHVYECYVICGWCVIQFDILRHLFTCFTSLKFIMFIWLFCIQLYGCDKSFKSTHFFRFIGDSIHVLTQFIFWIEKSKCSGTSRYH